MKKKHDCVICLMPMGGFAFFIALAIVFGCTDTRDAHLQSARSNGEVHGEQLEKSTASRLRSVPIKVEMPREVLEKLVETATRKQSDYNIYSMYDQTEATYTDGVTVLRVKFNRGYPHGMGAPGQESIPAIDSTVLSWTFTRN